MGAAADDLLRDDDERAAVRRVRERKAEQQKEAAEKEYRRLDLGTTLYRMKRNFTGEEKPTRESNEDYRKRMGH